MIIYKITNKVNGKIYIGQTTRSIKFRWKRHVEAARYTSNSILHKAIRKYGEHSFEIELIEYADDKVSLNEKEIFWISHFNSTDSSIGYNITKGGASPSHKPKASDEQKTKNSMILLERIKNGFKGHLGYTHSEESKAQMSIKNKGINRYTKEALIKKSKLMSGANNPVYKDVDKKELLSLLIEHPSIYLIDIAKHFEVSKQTIITKIRSVLGSNISSIPLEKRAEVYKELKEKL
jgi:group I intron endonuclease